MPSEALNHNDHMDIELNGKVVLPVNLVGIGFLAFIWRLDFRI